MGQDVVLQRKGPSIANWADHWSLPAWSLTCTLFQLHCKDSFYVSIVRRISVLQGIRERYVMRSSTCFFFHFVKVGSCALLTSTCDETIWVEERLHMLFTSVLDGVK